jgi:hypothetical protein
MELICFIMRINTERCTFEMWINNGDILEQALVELVITQWNNSSYLVTLMPRWNKP